jgi:hypothetical protein
LALYAYLFLSGLYDDELPPLTEAVLNDLVLLKVGLAELEYVEPFQYVPYLASFSVSILFTESAVVHRFAAI